MSEGQNFSNVFLGGKDRALGALGELRADSVGIKWKSRTTGKEVKVASSDMRGLSWARVRGGNQLRVHLKGGSSLKFEGLKPADRGPIEELCRGYGQELKALALSSKGLSWGAASVEGAMIKFEVDGLEAFELPLTEVQQATIQQKNEVSLEMHTHDALAPEDEMVTEIRFNMPPAAGGDEEGGEEEGAAFPRAENFLNAVISKADLAISGDAIASLDDVPMAVPRGRYEFEFFAQFFKLHGKAYDFKVMYSSVVGVYVLPKPDNYHVNVAVHLEPPIRQGATFYQFLLMQFPAEESLDLTLTMAEDALKERFDGRLTQQLSGYSHEVVASLITGLTGKPLHTPSPSYKAHGGASALRCAQKSADGYLFMYPKAFIFADKPTTLIAFDQVGSVEFRRVEKEGAGASNNKSFDMVVFKKGGESLQFANIRRNEYQALFRFLQEKKLKIQNIAKASGGLEDFDDMETDEEGKGEEDDLHMRKIKRARERAAAASNKPDDDDSDDDDDDESDEDFKGGDESDIDEEYDEDGIDGDEEAVQKKNKGAKTKAKEGAKDNDAAKPKEDDDDDDDGEDAKEESESDDEKPAKKSTSKPAAKSKAAKADKVAASPKGKRAKKEKPKKDPNAPKKPLGSYMIFAGERRVGVKAEKPGLTLGEMGKELGRLWKEVDAEEKSEFEAKAATAKKAYALALEAYKRTQGKGEEDGDGYTHADADEEEADPYEDNGDDDDDGPAVVDDDDE